MKRAHSDTAGDTDGHVEADSPAKRTKHTIAVLYWNPDSSHSRLAYIYAKAVNADVEAKFVNLATGEVKSREFLNINPAGQVPTLSDGDMIISESASIMRYLAHKYPSKLYPLDNLAVLGRVDYANEFIRQKAWDVNSTFVMQAHWGPMFGKNTPPETLAATKGKLMTALDKLVSFWFKDSPDHVVGTELSMADITLGVLLWNITVNGKYDLSIHPKLKSFYEKMHELPAFKAADAARPAPMSTAAPVGH